MFSYVFLLFSVFLIKLATAACPPNYQLIKNSCFGLRTTANLNWDEADKLCHRDHARLARVDPDHLTLLTNVLPRGARAWIGLRYDKSLQKWLWTSDHSSVNLQEPYLKSLDANPTEEDDCAVIRMKKGVLNIETDTCADTWINSGLCFAEKEQCGYSLSKAYSDCAYRNVTCKKEAVYEIDDGSLPRHLNVCQIDEVNCKVSFKNTTDGTNCTLECGENVGINDTLTVSVDCKRVILATACDCREAELALARAQKPDVNQIGIYVGIAFLCFVIAVLVIVILVGVIRKRMRYHSEQIHPPPATTNVRYTVNAVKYKADTATF